jgi:hypothetical protein
VTHLIGILSSSALGDDTTVISHQKPAKYVERWIGPSKFLELDVIKDVGVGRIFFMGTEVPRKIKYLQNNCLPLRRNNIS